MPTPIVAVHPRVGGEHTRPRCARPRAGGSSPRGRGTLRAQAGARLHTRFIPAWAGNTRLSWRRPWGAAVHPRVGGEHHRGLPPCKECVGSSPRGRGTRSKSSYFKEETRFIPAWAGNTWAWSSHGPAAPVHPRVGGEHTSPGTTTPAGVGSSPRGRGTRVISRSAVAGWRFIPAWAGNTRSHCQVAKAAPVHPRVGGEHQLIRPRAIVANGSSPRGRGTPVSYYIIAHCTRFIPAWAGNTDVCWSRRPPAAVHPRVGGEHPVCRLNR